MNRVCSVHLTYFRKIEKNQTKEEKKNRFGSHIKYLCMNIIKRMFFFLSINCSMCSSASIRGCVFVYVSYKLQHTTKSKYPHIQIMTADSNTTAKFNLPKMIL